MIATGSGRTPCRSAAHRGEERFRASSTWCACGDRLRDELGSELSVVDVPAELAAELRHVKRLVEAVAEMDDG